ncbi:DUF3306 domain-containing protein [Methylonatrum kenyense]|uniref:DUF3306 domain-containing protein n=1 Tax=Methylonatrum kenyense TaxID=455253 RepID=UPI0020BDAB19|nr:DUF3306 domain-containing protein [Methylonatrum kenyense]MCK8514809.1 DUF3306 domain-containing protein [Methylonatrum kenyense]
MSTRPTDQFEQQEGGAVGLLSRWSRRKQQAQAETSETLPSSPELARDEVAAEAVEDDPDERIDPRTGKRFSELTDDDMPALDSLMPDSDLSMFMAKNISPALRMKALTRVFHSAKFNKVCLCAEYAEDYTTFEPLGDVIPHDLKASIAREAKRLRDSLLGQGEEISPEEAEARIWRETRHSRSTDAVPRDELAESRWHRHEQSMRDAEAAEVAETEEEHDKHDV